LYYPKWKVGASHTVISWNLAAKYFWQALSETASSFFGVFCGSFLDLQAALYLKTFVNSFGCSNIFLMDNPFFDLVDFRFYFQLNSTLELLESQFNVLFLGLNIRLEIPLLNARLRKAYMAYDFFSAYSMGCSLNFLTYPVQNISNSFSDILNMFEGKTAFSTNAFLHDFFGLVYFNFNLRILDLFIGLTFAVTNNIVYTKFLVINAFVFIRNLNLDISSLHLVFGKIGSLSLLEFGAVKNLFPQTPKFLQSLLMSKGKPIFYFCGVDLDNINMSIFMQTVFLIYQGSFYHAAIDLISLVLPVTVYTESNLHFLNLEGRYRVGEAAVMPSDKIFPDWKLFRFLFIASKLFAHDLAMSKLNLVSGIHYNC
jgi:NADH-quinone oxidoreductase subunit G